MSTPEYEALLKRYENLKKQYFSNRSNRMIDDEGQEVPHALPREVIIQQFERMGCQIPRTPDEPFTPAQVQQPES